MRPRSTPLPKSKAAWTLTERHVRRAISRRPSCNDPLRRPQLYRIVLLDTTERRRRRALGSQIDRRAGTRQKGRDATGRRSGSRSLGPGCEFRMRSLYGVGGGSE
jgi:hypothetical protein